MTRVQERRVGRFRTNGASPAVPPERDRFDELMTAAGVLADSASPAEALDQLVHLASSAFGDFAVVIVPRDHQFHVIAAAHRDPAKDVLARMLLGQVPVAPHGGSPAAQAFKTGLPVMVCNLRPSDVMAWFGDDAYSEWAKDMELSAVLAIPLKSRGSVVGVMTLGLTCGKGDTRQLDLDAASPLTSLIAIAVRQAADSFTNDELKAAFQHNARTQANGSTAGIRSGSILIVDPFPVDREGIKSLVGTIGGLSICGEAVGLQDAADLACQPALVVTGLVLEDCAGPQVVARLLDAFPDANLLVISRIDRPLFVHLALAAGAKGYLLKSAPPGEVVEAIRRVSDGEPYVQPRLGAALVQWHASLPGGIEGGRLTQREREVLGLVALGHTNAEIASITGVSLRTVETHRSHLAQKLGVHSRADLVARAQELSS